MTPKVFVNKTQIKKELKKKFHGIMYFLSWHAMKKYIHDYTTQKKVV